VLVWWKGNIKKLSLYNSIVYHNGAQWYEPHRHRAVLTGRLTRSGFYLAWFIMSNLDDLSSKRLCVFHLHGAVYIYIYIYLDNFFVMAHSLLHLLVSWAWWDCLSTWLTNRRPSVLWHCWLGHLTHKVLRKMTYNVSSGTLNPTVLILIQSFVDIVVPAEWKQNGWRWKLKKTGIGVCV